MMPHPVIGLPSSPRPPGKNRSASSANQDSIHALTAGSSGKRIDYQRHRSVPSGSRRSTIPLPGRHSAHHPTTSEIAPISSPVIHKQDMPSSRNSQYVERRKTNQPKTNTRYVYTLGLGNVLAEYPVVLHTRASYLRTIGTALARLHLLQSPNGGPAFLRWLI